MVERETIEASITTRQIKFNSICLIVIDAAIFCLSTISKEARSAAIFFSLPGASVDAFFAALILSTDNISLSLYLESSFICIFYHNMY